MIIEAKNANPSFLLPMYFESIKVGICPLYFVRIALHQNWSSLIFRFDKGRFLFVTAAAHGIHLNNVVPKNFFFEKYLFLWMYVIQSIILYPLSYYREGFLRGNLKTVIRCFKFKISWISWDFKKSLSQSLRIYLKLLIKWK